MSTEAPTKAYPLKWPFGWPRTSFRRRSRFGTWKQKPTIAAATDEVLRELDRMGASAVVISTDLQLRLDGLPRSGQPIPKDPGVAVYFTRKGTAQVLACDTFDLPGCNLYAISRTINALRQMERDGCSTMLERAFEGFKALPEKASPSSWMTVLELPQDCTLAMAQEAHRRLVKKHHSDVGGDPAKFQEVSTAWADARKHFMGQ